MNELMNRDYEVDVNEGDLDDEFAELEAQYYQDMKNKNPANRNQNPQVYNNMSL